MNLADRLFQVIDGEPVYTPVLINIKCFKELYKLDTSEDKHKYSQHLVFIWYIADPRSPFFNSEDKYKDASREVYGKTNKAITKVLKKCIDEYIKREQTASMRALDKAIRASDSISGAIISSEQEVLEIDRLINDIVSLSKAMGKDPEDILERLDLTDRLIELKIKRVKLSKDIVGLIPAINKQVTSLLELKKIVNKDRILIEDNQNNKDAVSNFIIDRLISSKNR